MFFFSSRRRHTRFDCDWSSDVCSSDLQRQTAHKSRSQGRTYSGRARNWCFSRMISTNAATASRRSEEHTSELQSQSNLVCRLLLEKKKTKVTSVNLQSIYTCTAMPLVS